MLTPSEALAVTLHMQRLERERIEERDALDPPLTEFPRHLCDGSTANMLGESYVSPDHALYYAGVEVGGQIVDQVGCRPDFREVEFQVGSRAAARLAKERG